ncbi:hypothetical protein T4D_4339 [Trichinella pseudospiralis]|uniref:Integrase catalytic domain-containing protein n=1 Tax=Trichinella pseudospiralis TaxID=6337 RepID=A0A0V1F626_TRIPS|nr:hypothetical protein T4D_4339 [Trichinella pseudospiralis]
MDAYYSFPFALPCADVSAVSAEKCLIELFSLFGVPSYVHADHWSAFASDEFCIACSRIASYTPQSNVQGKRYTVIVWKTILQALKSHELPTEQDTVSQQVLHTLSVLPDALHVVRSFLCTSTNATAHERFLAFARHLKSDPLLEVVELLEVNPTYAYIRFFGRKRCKN